MRYGLLAVALVVLPLACIGVVEGWFANAGDRLTTSVLSDDARKAIEIRCGIHDDRAAHECRSTLKKLYLSGSLDPDRTLRVWCEAVKDQRWGGSRPPPPELCVRRYGGWKAG